MNGVTQLLFPHELLYITTSTPQTHQVLPLFQDSAMIPSAWKSPSPPPPDELQLILENSHSSVKPSLHLCQLALPLQQSYIQDLIHTSLRD